MVVAATDCSSPLTTAVDLDFEPLLKSPPKVAVVVQCWNKRRNSPKEMTVVEGVVAAAVLLCCWTTMVATTIVAAVLLIKSSTRLDQDVGATCLCRTRSYPTFVPLDSRSDTLLPLQ